jgi:D-sedoheptulose 7-phosphate isomerase
VETSEVLKVVSEKVSSFIDVSQNPAAFVVDDMVEAIELCVSALMTGNKLAFVGNGGSAAEAMHLAAEFTGKCLVDHKPLDAICLNESQSSLTAIANDYGFDQVFARQARAHLKSGDVLFALSTSGKSSNIRQVIDVAIELQVKVFLWMGDFETEITGPTIWKVPSQTTSRIQEIHLAWGHILSEAIELHYSI